MRRSTVTIRSVTEEDWRELRGLRLEMLDDTPIAYQETWATASELPETEWRLRGRRGQDPRQASFVAIDDATMQWVGMMGGFLPGDGVPLRGGVFVAPSHRGAAAGVADGLLARIEEWARPFGDRLLLEVHEDNSRAIRFYERHGFRDTGRRIPYELAPFGQEWQMAKPL
jgi:GNAT superfamily N-acetyltransferase